jgi:hypothetical protein
MTTESVTLQRVQLEAPRLGVTLWRNNVGACRDDTGRMIRYGLGNISARSTAVATSSDLIGMTRDGRFLAVECKRPDWRGTSLTPREGAQRRFIEIVRARGGVGGFVRNVEELRRLIADPKCPIVQELNHA